MNRDIVPIESDLLLTETAMLPRKRVVSLVGKDLLPSERAACTLVCVHCHMMFGRTSTHTLTATLSATLTATYTATCGENRPCPTTFQPQNTATHIATHIATPLQHTATDQENRPCPTTFGLRINKPVPHKRDQQSCLFCSVTSLQHTATHTVTHTATHCNTMCQQTRHKEYGNSRNSEIHHTATHCNTLQSAATRCNPMQHTVTTNLA